MAGHVFPLGSVKLFLVVYVVWHKSHRDFWKLVGVHCMDYYVL